jgi:molybdenum cofactor cytidylyltransferase
MLEESLGVAPGDCVAVVGAGGKTSLCWRLVQELAHMEGRVVFTTTTRIRQPAPGVFDQLLIGPQAEVTSELTSTLDWGTACIAASLDGPPDDRPVVESIMPVVHTKLIGHTRDQICTLRTSLNTPPIPQPLSPNLQSTISLIVEADGARGRLIKAPAEYEPVIPPCADVVCVVANLAALRQPLDERIAHRPERIAALTGLPIGQPVTPEVLVSLLAHPEGGLKGIPSGARKLAVLVQRDEQTLHSQAESLVQELIAQGYDHAVVITRGMAGG